MDELRLLTTLVGGLAAALLLGYAAHRLRLSPIVGYLLAGVAVGPFTPGFVANQKVAEQFAEIGVILLLFGIGLRFHLRELMAVWRTAVPGALLQSSLSTVTMALLARTLGWSWTEGIVLGLAISVSSTVVMARVLGDRHDLHTPIGHLAMGWTVVEDLITVTILLFLPLVLRGQDTGPARVLSAMGAVALEIAGLVAVIVVLGRWVIPGALERVAATRSRELFTLAVLVLALGLAVGSARLFGVSMALGAFMAGLAVGRSEFAARAAGDALPMRDAFAVLFFVSVGMRFDPWSIAAAPAPTLLVLAVVLLGKPGTTLLVMHLLGRPRTLAVPVGAALSQVGEFSFILGSVARELGALESAGWHALVAGAIVSITLNPTYYGRARRSHAPAAVAPRPESGPRPPVDHHRCILVGYGPVGHTVYRLLSDGGALVTVIELNLDTVRRLRAEGVSVLYGDVLRPGTLEEAGVATAGSLVLSADVEDAAEIVRQARACNPGLRVMVRCAHLRDAAALRAAGASIVAAGEAEVAVALAEAVTAAASTGAQSPADEQRAALRRRLYEGAGPA